MGKGNVWVDLAGEGGVPLFKKFAMFDSGFVPAERTCRDAALFRRCRISSLRMDLFIGEPAAEFGSMVEETPEGLHYNWEKADRLVKVLEENGVSPYFSWCYVPLPVQPEGGNFRSVPADWEKYREIMKDFAAHFKQMGSPLGYQEIYNEPVNPGAFLTEHRRITIPYMNMGLWESGTGIRRPWWEGRQKLLSFLLPNAGIMPPVSWITYREKSCPWTFSLFIPMGSGKRFIWSVSG